jgi:hypothetical protein
MGPGLSSIKPYSEVLPPWVPMGEMLFLSFSFLFSILCPQSPIQAKSQVALPWGRRVTVAPHLV